MIEGVDYSTDHPRIAELARSGIRFAARYVGPGSPAKHLTPEEAVELTRHGISIVCVAEGYADGLKFGRPMGTSWAEMAHDHAVECGAPENVVIYFAADWDVRGYDFAKLGQALDGAADVLGRERVGVYGSFSVIEWAQREAVAPWRWQTYAWSAGKISRHAHVHQYRNGVSLAGGDVDLNHALVADFGQWSVAPTKEGRTAPMGSVWDEDVIPAPPDAADRDVNPTWRAKNALSTVLSTVRAMQTSAAAKEDRDDVLAVTMDERHMELTRGMDRLGEAIKALESTPLIDAVAVAAAIASNPEIARTLAEQVAGQLAKLSGEITLTGSLTGRVGQ